MEGGEGADGGGAAARPRRRRELEGLQTAVSENMSTIEEIAEELEAHAAVAGQDAATTKAKLKERQLAERELRGRVDGARAARTKLLASLHAEAVAATEALAAEQATAARAAEKVVAETAASTAASASAAEARAREGEAQAAALARAAADAEKAVADLTAELAKAERTSAAIVREAAPELEGLRAAAATLATRRPRRWRPSPAQLHGWLGALGKGEAMPVALGPTDAQKRWVLVVGQADGGGAALAVYKGTAAVVAGTAEGRVARLPLRRCWRIEAGGGSALHTITVAIAPADPPAAAAVDVDAPPGGVVALTAPGREVFARWFLALQALSACRMTTASRTARPRSGALRRPRLPTAAAAAGERKGEGIWWLRGQLRALSRDGDTVKIYYPPPHPNRTRPTLAALEEGRSPQIRVVVFTSRRGRRASSTCSTSGSAAAPTATPDSSGGPATPRSVTGNVHAHQARRPWRRLAHPSVVPDHVDAVLGVGDDDSALVVEAEEAVRAADDAVLLVEIEAGQERLPRGKRGEAAGLRAQEIEVGKLLRLAAGRPKFFWSKCNGVRWRWQVPGSLAARQPELLAARGGASPWTAPNRSSRIGTTPGPGREGLLVELAPLRETSQFERLALESRLLLLLRAARHRRPSELAGRVVVPERVVGRASPPCSCHFESVCRRTFSKSSAIFATAR